MNFYGGEVEVLKFSPMFTPANICFSIIFRGEYRQLQNHRLEHGNTDLFVCIHTCAAVDLIIRFQVDVLRLGITELGRKINKRNTARKKKNAFIFILI